jgi:CheY-like chemotaxis protein
MIFKVLIIDDDYINRRLLLSLLKKALYKIEIIESVDGKDALKKLKENLDIQLILLDVEMPNMDGSKFLKHYVEECFSHQVPIIAVSSNDLRIKEILMLGASAFIVKPVTENKLLNAIMKSQNRQT